MADSYVVSGAVLKCPFGTSPSKLTVLPSRTVFMAGMPMGNISDFKPLVNIASFGMCFTLTNPVVAAATASHLGVLTPMPCVPNTVSPWTPGKPDVLVQNMPALLKSCTCQCMWGGVLAITDDGQHGVGCGDLVKTPKETFKTVKG